MTPFVVAFCLWLLWLVDRYKTVRHAPDPVPLERLRLATADAEARLAYYRQAGADDATLKRARAAGKREVQRRRKAVWDARRRWRLFGAEVRQHNRRMKRRAIVSLAVAMAWAGAIAWWVG